MKFRPCIDLHNGVVKQIVGSTLSENSSEAPVENFVASKPAADFARSVSESVHRSISDYALRDPSIDILQIPAMMPKCAYLLNKFNVTQSI